VRSTAAGGLQLERFMRLVLGVWLCACACSGAPVSGDGGAISVSVTPMVAHAMPAGSVLFHATVTGAVDGSVDWTVADPAAGSVTSDGAYTAPASAGTYQVVATSRADHSASGTATVVVASVASCASLPAAGIWEQITPPGVDETDALVADPFDSGTVWLGTNNTGLFKSTDCGATWTHVNTGRNGAMLDQGAMESMQLDPVNHGTIYTVAWNGSEGLWKSTNGGVDWDQLFPAGSEVAKVVFANEVSSIAMEANHPNHLIVGMHAVCAAPYGPICEAESTDGGATWTITHVPAPCTLGYCPGAGAFILDEKTWIFGTYSDGLWLTADRGTNWSNIVPNGAQGATGGKTLNQPFVPDSNGKYYLASQQGILTSSDGKAWSLIPGSGGSAVGFAIGGGRLYASDQWTLSYNSATVAAPTSWSKLPAPAAPPFQSYQQGGTYLHYDEAHHILYSSNWHGGAWRMVTE